MKNLLLMAAVLGLVSCGTETVCDCSPECAAKCHGDSVVVDSVAFDSTGVESVEELLDTLETLPAAKPE
jgi:hypothetical protein